MRVYQEQINVCTKKGQPTFVNLTEQLNSLVRSSRISNGLCTIYTHHTTCSVIIEEFSHDVMENGLEFLQQDLCDALQKIIPEQTHDGLYAHPGPMHIRNALYNVKETDAAVCLNTDAHLRSCILGRSEAVVINGGALDLGEFASVYFIDWDCVRSRERKINVQIIGE